MRYPIGRVHRPISLIVVRVYLYMLGLGNLRNEHVTFIIDDDNVLGRRMSENHVNKVEGVPGKIYYVDFIGPLLTTQEGGKVELTRHMERRHRLKSSVEKPRLPR